jgi:hypothetical protein
VRTPRLIGRCVLGAVVSLSAGAFADVAPGPEAVLSCERRPGRGRVVCELELEVSRGRIAWADAVVVEVPPMAKPLKSRIGFREVTMHTEQRVRLPIGLVATRLGEGRLSVRARSVVCEGVGKEEACLTHTRRVSTVVQVGPIRSR